MECESGVEMERELDFVLALRCWAVEMGRYLARRWVVEMG